MLSGKGAAGIPSDEKGVYMKKIRNYFKIVCFLFQSARKNKIRLEWGMVALTLVRCLLPFPMIYFPAAIIEALVNGRRMPEILGLIVLMVITSTGLLGLERCIQKTCNIMLERLKSRLHENLSEAVMRMPYEIMESDAFIKKVERARVAVNGDLSWSVLRGVSGPRGVNAICIGFSNIFVGIVQILCYIYILSTLHIGIVLLIIVSVLLNSFLSTKKKRIDFSQRERTSEMSTRMNTCYMAMDDVRMAKDIRLFGMEHFLIEKHKGNRRDYFKVRRSFFTSYLGIEGSALLISGLQNVVIYGYLAWNVVKGRFSIGYFSKYFSTIMNFVNSLSTIIESVVNMNLFGEYMEDYYEIVDKKEEEKSRKKSLPELHSIVFENVWFMYPGTTEYVLKDINLTIEAGNKILLVGLNGAGKSTLVKLLLGLYEPSKGRILIDGTDVKELDRGSYITLFSAVFQDYMIYAESLKENIMFDHTDLPRMEDIIKRLKISQILEDNQIQYNDSLSKEFDYNGKELSQGQKQRMALARALFKPSQVLVLDEPTAALDASAEYQLYRDFDEIVDGRTVLYISHRLSAAMLCNRIIVIKKGEITEEGSHEQLLARRADYFEMYTKQAQSYK